MAKNLLMSWESALEMGPSGTVQGGAGAQVFSVALIAVWGVLCDVGTFLGRNSETVREWVLEGIRALQGDGVKGLNAELMDEMADLLAGGPVRGLLPVLMGKEAG